MNKKRVSWLLTDYNITVNYDGQTHIVSRADDLADRLIKALKDQDYDAIPNLVSLSKKIEDFSDGNFVVKDGEIFVDGVLAPPVLGNKIVKFAKDGLPYQPLIKFARNLQKNPSFRAVTELFQFLEKNDHPLTENGCFIAYKRVDKNFKDLYSGTFDNSVGKIVEMPRNQVNEDANVTCSNGLHVANWHYAHHIYAKSSDGLMLEVEVNPADVVSVPVDYNQSKMRVCKYKVLGVVDQEHSSDIQLRITQPDVFFEEDENECCRNCGEANENLTDGLCWTCEGGEDDEYEYEDDDDYPWEDEI